MGRAYQNRKESMAKTAGQKTRLYSRYGKEIYICAKQGGTDPDGNLALRSLITRAKKIRSLLMLLSAVLKKPKAVAVKIMFQRVMKVLAQATAW